jgi:DNA-binding protein HU-beta
MGASTIFNRGRGGFMNKNDLTDRIATGAGITKAAAAKALDSLVEGITSALEDGDKVTLVGFGTFSTSERAARTGRNPRTGKKLKIAAKKVVRFKAGSRLADAMN